MNSLSYIEYCGNKRKVGEYFGYPPCCIDEFMRTRGSHNKERSKASKNTGFIPCSAHTEQILAGEIRLKDLITNRTCNTRFPKDEDELLDQYRKMFRKKVRFINIHNELKTKRLLV